jgi:hypothetical protein
MSTRPRHLEFQLSIAGLCAHRGLAGKPAIGPERCLRTAEVTRINISRSFKSPLQSCVCAIKVFLIRTVRVRKGERAVEQTHDHFRYAEFALLTGVWEVSHNLKPCQHGFRLWVIDEQP